MGSAVEAASLGQPAGGQASGTAAAATRQASDTMADNAPQKLGTAPGQTTAKNSSATSTGAPSQENSIGGVGQTPTKPDEKQPSLVDRTLNQLKQVRPPQVPNDEAGGGTVHVRLDHGSE